MKMDSQMKPPDAYAGAVGINKKRVIKLAIGLSFSALATVFLLVGILYYLGLRAELSKLETRESSIVTVQSRFITSKISTVFSDLLFVANNNVIHSIFDSDPTLRAQGISHLEEEFQRLSRAKAIYDQIRLVDLQGNELVRVNFNSGSVEGVAANQLQNKRHRYYFTESLAMSRGQIYISPLDLNVENNAVETPYKPMIRFGTPVFDREGTKQGVILFNYLAEGLLNRVDALSKTSEGDLYLLNEKGYYLRSPVSSEEWGFMFPNKKKLTFENQHPEIWQTLVAEETIQQKTASGLYSTTTIHSLGSWGAKGSEERVEYRLGTPWKIVSFVSSSVIEQAQWVWKKILIIIGILISLILFVAAWVIAYSVVAREEAATAEHRLVEVLTTTLEQVRSLSGMVPICAKCKKIRDDKGYWDSVEHYIEEHSEASFSHGICPTCEEEMWGDQTWWQKKKAAEKAERDA